MLMKQQYEDEIVRLRRQLDTHPLKGDPDGRGGVRSSGLSGFSSRTAFCLAVCLLLSSSLSFLLLPPLLVLLVLLFWLPVS